MNTYEVEDTPYIKVKRANLSKEEAEQIRATSIVSHDNIAVNAEQFLAKREFARQNSKEIIEILKNTEKNRELSNAVKTLSGLFDSKVESSDYYDNCNFPCIINDRVFSSAEEAREYDRQQERTSLQGLERAIKKFRSIKSSLRRSSLSEDERLSMREGVSPDPARKKFFYKTVQDQIDMLGDQIDLLEDLISSDYNDSEAFEASVIKVKEHINFMNSFLSNIGEANERKD